MVLPWDEAAGGSGGEHLLVWTWRRIGAGRGGCPLIARAFSEACGDDAAEVFATFCTFLQVLAQAGRRRLRIGHPGCVGLTGDERQLLALVAAAQADDTAHLEAHLRWLARAELHDALALAARALATALRVHDLLLSPPASIVPMARRREAVQALALCERCGAARRV